MLDFINHVKLFISAGKVNKNNGIIAHFVARIKKLVNSKKVLNVLENMANIKRISIFAL